MECWDGGGMFSRSRSVNHKVNSVFKVLKEEGIVYLVVESYWCCWIYFKYTYVACFLLINKLIDIKKETYLVLEAWKSYSP